SGVSTDHAGGEAPPPRGSCTRSVGGRPRRPLAEASRAAIGERRHGPPGGGGPRRIGDDPAPRGSATARAASRRPDRAVGTSRDGAPHGPGAERVDLGRQDFCEDGRGDRMGVGSLFGAADRYTWRARIRPVALALVPLALPV